MKPIQWKISRGSIEVNDAQSRWDQVYQNLLSKIKQTEAEPSLEQPSLPDVGSQLSQLQPKQEVLK